MDQALLRQAFSAATMPGPGRGPAARLAGLSVVLDHLRALASDADDARRPADAHRGRVRVDVLPAQRQGLAAAHAGVREHAPQGVILAVLLGPGQEGGELG